MGNETENYLSAALKRLELAYQQILKTSSYTEEVEKIKILTELLVEQTENENSRPTAR